MGFWDSLRKTFDNDNENEDENVNGYDDEEETAVEEKAATKVTAPTRVSSSVASASNLEMKLCKPTRFDEVTKIATHLLEHKTVVLNLEGASRETVIRIIDFLSGVTYAINGQIKNVASSTYVITPDHVEVTSEQKAEAEAATAATTTGVKQPRELF